VAASNSRSASFSWPWLWSSSPRLGPQRIAQAVVGIGRFGVEGDRFLVGGDRRVEFLLVPQRIAQAIVGSGIFGVEGSLRYPITVAMVAKFAP
jgi:hypothetical protein